MTRILITGANRGIGLALAERYAALPDVRLFATCRKPAEATALKALADAYPDRVTILPLDVIDDATIAAARDAVAGVVDGLDVLINNAGINPPGKFQTLEAINAEGMLFILHVNTVGPLMVAQAFASLLRAGTNARLVNVSSQMGSLSRGMSNGYYGYRPSKAALNMVTRSLAADLRGDGVTVITLHPGWVQTDMGGPNADINTDESADGIVRLVDGLTLDNTGAFFRWDGSEHPW